MEAGRNTDVALSCWEEGGELKSDRNCLQSGIMGGNNLFICYLKGLLATFLPCRIQEGLQHKENNYKRPEFKILN